MIDNKHRREQTRFTCLVPVVIFRETTHMPSSVLMQNYSDGGIYFEISDPLHSGDPIIVRTDDSSIVDPVGSGSGKLRLAEVKWCVEIGKGGARRYGCGAQFM